jgi:mitochondrial chaperone BCS1
MFDQLLQLLTNQFVSGGLLLMLTGSLIAFCRRVPFMLFHWTQRRCSVVIDVENTDPCFEWLKVWMNSHTYSKRSRALSISSRWEEDDDGISHPHIIFTPAPGNHLFIYKKRLVWMERSRSPIEGAGNKSTSVSSLMREQINLRIYTRKQDIARELGIDALKNAHGQSDTRVRIMVPHYGGWRMLSRSAPRPVSSVILADGQANLIMEDIQEFFASATWYKNLGIPYRRSYMLHGEPGSGKSSLVKAIAGELKLDIYVINLGSSFMNDQKLVELLLCAPSKSVFLFEDIDAAFNGRVKGEDASDGLTFSGLLNALDGVAAKEGGIFFMTTNHIEQLDPALIRPGRVDLKVGFEKATRNQVEELFARFYPNAARSLAEEFAQKVGEKTVSMATVQSYLQGYKKQPEIAVRMWGVNDDHGTYQSFVRADFPALSSCIGKENDHKTV